MKTIIQTFFFFLLVTQICFAQRVQTNGPNGSRNYSLAISGNNIFAETFYDGIFWSIDTRSNWNAGGLINLSVNSLAISGDNIFAGTDVRVRRGPLSEIIPLELITFTAATNGKEVILNWSTATETNNRGFSKERKSTNSEFSEIGFVLGFGTTTERQDYSYSNEVFTNRNYSYRLKQIDYLGNYEYSDVVEVDFRSFNSYFLSRTIPILLIQAQQSDME